MSVKRRCGNCKWAVWAPESNLHQLGTCGYKPKLPTPLADALASRPLGRYLLTIDSYPACPCFEAKPQKKTH